jgi:hypothetical protein
MMAFEPRARSSSHILHLISFLGSLQSIFENVEVLTVNALHSVQWFSFVGC